MRTRTKALIVILLAVLYFVLIQYGCDDSKELDSPDDKSGTPGTAAKGITLSTDLKMLYDEYNNEYFGDKLPKDAIIDWAEYDSEYMATTIRMTDGTYHIAFNEKYVQADRVLKTTLLHEMCHIPTYDDFTVKDGWHGKRWRACMLGLDMRGAFRRELIDGYEGQ